MSASGTTILGEILLGAVSHPLTHSSLEILKDWVDLIDDDGWVAREQILGEEARSKVCSLGTQPRDHLTRC